MKLQNYSIMPLIPDRIDEICADVERQVKERVCVMPLFMMTLVPVGTPPRQEAMICLSQNAMYRARDCS